MLYGCKLLVIHLYGNSTPYWDQWDSEAHLLYDPFLDGRLAWQQVLTPHCDHHIVFTKLLSLGLLSTNGIWNPLLQMVVNAGLHVGFICLLASLLTRVVGQRYLPAILGFCLFVFCLPYGWENTLAGFQSQFYFVLLFSLGAIWLVITASPFSTRWWKGVSLAVGAFLSFASGVFAPASLAGVGAIQYFTGTRTTKLHAVSVLALGALFVLGVVLTPTVAIHAPLKASTLAQYLHSWNSMMGWPINAPLIGPLFRYAPAALLAAMMLRRAPPANDPRWFLLTLVAWTFLQGSAIAYGRALGGVASRYMDLFAVDLLINFACLLAVVRDKANRHSWMAPAAATWPLVVLGCLGVGVYRHCPAHLQARHDTALAQEFNTRNYVLTGDMSHLTDKPFLHVPYPIPKRLAAALDDPTLREILPTNIGAPLQGSLLASDPHNACVVDGYSPELPSPKVRCWGTHDADGSATLATGAIAFPGVHRGYDIEIPVAGNLQAKGISLDVEQDGKRWRLTTVAHGNDPWQRATARVHGRPFTLHISDASTDAWIAVGSPVAVGRWDALVRQLLTRWAVFVILGSVLAISLVTFACLTPAASRNECLKDDPD